MGRGARLFGSGAAALAAATLALTCVSQADAAPAFEGSRLSFDLALTSDHVVHGVTRSQGEPAAQAHLGLSRDSGWLVGVWLSTVDFGFSEPRYEIDPSIGKRWLVGRDWSVRADLTRYLFRPRSQWQDYDYTELRGSVAFRDALEIAVTWAPDYSGYSWVGPAYDRRMLTYEASARFPTRRWLTLTAGAGRRDLQDAFGASYWYWSAGTEAATERVSFAITYIGTSRKAEDLYGRDDAGDRVVATLAFRVK